MGDVLDPSRLKQILQQFKDGELSEIDVLNALGGLPFEDMGFAKVDHHRSLRTGLPEVVYAAGKTTGQIMAIAQSMIENGTDFLVTRLPEEAGHELAERYPEGTWVKEPRIFFREAASKERFGYTLVITAGTSDIPVAEEAAITATLFGCNVDRIYDVGVAGVHRLMSYRSMIEAADIIVVAAGMEGALASVVAGITKAPVIALPTSVGYGASFSGLAALLGMMTSCAPGVSVVNIDNGFGAGCAAAIICRKAHELAERAGETDRQGKGS